MPIAVGGIRHVDDCGHTVDAISQDPLDADLERLVRRRAPDTRSGQLDLDDPGVLMDGAEDDVSSIGLKCGSNDPDRNFDLFAHLDPYSTNPGRTIVIVSAVLVAHQGGWDEILLVVGPIAIIAGLLILAKRRVDAASSPPDGS